MPVISSFPVVDCAGGIDSGHLSTDLDGFITDWWPPNISDPGINWFSSLTRHVPVQSLAKGSINTVKVNSFFDDYYNRIHVAPTELLMGNILSTQTAVVYVWNAYLVPKTLTAVDGLETGMLLEGQSSPPLLFQPLAELQYDLSVTQDGPLSVDTVVQWNFDTESPGVRIRATRVTIWAWVPDWEDGVVESLEWHTEIYASETLVEQRVAKRTVPRRIFTANLFAEERERQWLDLVLLSWSARIFAIPVWHDIQILQSSMLAGSDRVNCETEYLDFYVGGLVILRGESAFQFEAAEILAIDANGLDLVRPLQKAWAVGTRIYPGRTAQLLSEPEITRLTDTADELSVEFLVMENNDWPEVLPAVTYRGFPVLDARPDETKDIKHSQARLLATLDNDFALPKITDLAGVAMKLRGWRWLEVGRQAQAELRSLLYGLRGRQVAVWVPTHANDLDVVADVSSVSTVIDVAWCGVSRFGLQEGRQDIRIELYSGVVYYRRVTDATELSDDVERLVIDTALGVSVAAAQIARVCWMTLSRGASDRVEIDHSTDGMGVATCSLTFRGVRDDAVQ